MAREKDDAFNRPFASLGKLKVPEKKLASTPSPAPVRAAPPPRAMSDEDLFLEAVQGVRPVEQKAPRVGAPPPDPGRKPRRSDDAEVLAALADLCGGDGPFDITDTDEYIEGIADGIDRRLLKRLRAGEYAVQGHVDLHGLSRDEAKERVARFVLESRRAGKRCVLIVHGRGLHSKDQLPVLKQAVRSWMERGQLARSVLAFATARPSDGGAGAMYVLLRR